MELTWEPWLETHSHPQFQLAEPLSTRPTSYSLRLLPRPRAAQRGNDRARSTAHLSIAELLRLSTLQPSTASSPPINPRLHTLARSIPSTPQPTPVISRFLEAPKYLARQFRPSCRFSTRSKINSSLSRPTCQCRRPLREASVMGVVHWDLRMM
jgi:hypothetical protein